MKKKSSYRTFHKFRLYNIDLHIDDVKTESEVSCSSDRKALLTQTQNIRNLSNLMKQFGVAKMYVIVL